MARINPKSNQNPKPSPVTQTKQIPTPILEIVGGFVLNFFLVNLRVWSLEVVSVY